MFGLTRMCILKREPSDNSGPLIAVRKINGFHSGQLSIATIRSQTA
jgi:hypothetical protein